MNRKRGKRLLAVAIAVAVAVVGLVVRPWAPVRPKNLILISMDTVRPDHLGCYGYTRPTTPRLDAYARTGARFLQCTSSSSWTTPAHLTIFTGLEPATHGCVYYKYTGRLNERYNTMAKIFTRRGFRTAAFTGGIYAGTRFGLDVGFEKFVEAGENFISKIDKVWSWLAVDTQRPFFLFLHGYDAHRPYVPPAQYRTRFSDGYSGDYDVVDFCRSDRSEPSPVDLRYIVSQYDGEIAGIDDVLGDLLDRLKRRGILKDTLVIITTDHGDEFYEHDGCDHKHTLYDELTRAAWIMFGPSIPAVTVRDHVGTIDILPTVLELFDIDVDIPFQGRSRVSLLHGEVPPEDAPIFSFTGRQGKTGHRYHYSSVRTSRWKLVTDLPSSARTRCEKCLKGEPESTRVRLFDLKSDPMERTSVAADHPEVTRSLLRQLTARIAQSRRLGLAVTTPPEATPDFMKGLRSLGYVGDGEEDEDR